MSLVYNIVFTSLIMQYRKAQTLTGEILTFFDTFQIDHQNLTHQIV